MARHSEQPQELKVLKFKKRMSDEQKLMYVLLVVQLFSLGLMLFKN